MDAGIFVSSFFDQFQLLSKCPNMHTDTNIHTSNAYVLRSIGIASRFPLDSKKKRRKIRRMKNYYLCEIVWCIVIDGPIYFQNKQKYFSRCCILYFCFGKNTCTNYCCEINPFFLVSFTFPAGMARSNEKPPYVFEKHVAKTKHF